MSCCKRKQKTRQEVCKRNRSGSTDRTSTGSNSELFQQIQSPSDMFLQRSNSTRECSQIDERERQRQASIQLAGEELALVYHPFMEGDLPSWFKTHRNRSYRRKRRARMRNSSRRCMSRFEWKPYPHRSQDQLYHDTSQMHIQIHEPSIPRSYRLTQTSALPTTLAHVRPLSTNESRSQSSNVSLDESRCIWNRSRRITTNIDPTSNSDGKSNLIDTKEEDDDDWDLSDSSGGLIQPLITSMKMYPLPSRYICFQFHSFAGITYVRRVLSRISDDQDDQFGVVETLLREHQFVDLFFTSPDKEGIWHDYFYCGDRPRVVYVPCYCLSCYETGYSVTCCHPTRGYTHDATGNIILQGDYDDDDLHFRLLLGNELMTDLS